jgi:hypothetical protein
MAKNKISEWSSTPANNTDVGGIDIAEGCAPSGINNAIREMMAQVKDMQAGTDGDDFTVGGNLSVTGTTTLTGALTASGGVTGNLTGNVTGDVSGTSANVTGTVVVANGGTGATSLTANSVILGNGTSALSGNLVAPGTSGNVLTSDGTTWKSSAPQIGITTTTGSAPYYGARAFVNFDGTNGSIRASANVSSVTRNSAGDYTITFTTAMPDANYTVVGTSQARTTATSASSSGKEAILSLYATTPLTTTTCRFRTNEFGGDGQFGAPPQDFGIVCVTIFR